MSSLHHNNRTQLKVFNISIIHHPSSIIMREISLLSSALYCLMSGINNVQTLDELHPAGVLAANWEMVLVNVLCIFLAFFFLLSSFWLWLWFLISYLLHSTVTRKQSVLAWRWRLMHRLCLCAFSSASDARGHCPGIWNCSWHEKIRLSDRTQYAYNLRLLFNLISMLSGS